MRGFIAGEGDTSTITHLHYLSVCIKIDTRKIRDKIKNRDSCSTDLNEDLGCKVNRYHCKVNSFGKPDLILDIYKPIELDFDYSIIEAKTILGRRELCFPKLLDPDYEEENPIEYFKTLLCPDKKTAEEYIFGYLKEEFNITQDDMKKIRITEKFESPPKYMIGHTFVKIMEELYNKGVFLTNENVKILPE